MRLGFLVKDSLYVWRLVTILTRRTFASKTWCEGGKTPPVGNFVWLPVDVNSAKPAHPRCGVVPGGRQLAHAGFAVALSEVKEELVASGFSGGEFALYDVL